MKFVHIIIAVALVASLFMNYTLFTKLDDVDDRLSDFSISIESLNSETSNIQNAIYEIQQEQSWISEINSQVDLNDSKTAIIFNWQIKEQMNNANVEFHYKIGNKDEYTSIPAVDRNNGLYYATIPVEIVIEPRWIVHISHAGKNADQVKEEKQNDLQYFVSVSNDDLNKNSEINTISLNSLGSKDYGILDIPVDIDCEKFFHISLSNFHERYPAKKYVKNAYLLKFNEEELVEEEKLVPDGNTEEGDAFFRMKQPKKYEYTKLVVKVEYNDGKTFEKEVYSN